MYRGLGGILPALLALVLSSGGGLAAGDLFDDDYRDCPAKTRLREGQIADLTVARDAEDADEVNVSWTATDPASWGLGPNAYTTALVVLLDDGTQKQTRTVALGTRKVAFDKVDTGVEVTVQLAIVTDTADGSYLISDILEQDFHQSLTAPAFMTTEFWRVATLDDPDTPEDETRLEVIEDQSFYYVGYNENFGNYKADGLVTRPSTPRLRIGLAHAAAETNKQREDVEFDAYIVRITDAQGDMVPEGDDVATLMSAEYYGTRVLYVGLATATIAVADPPLMYRNVRINDGGTILRPSYKLAQAATPFLVGSIITTPPGGAVIASSAIEPAASIVYAEPPDEHRDFPIDVLTSDETYKFTAWSINDEGDIISPVAALSMRPVDRRTNITAISDYLSGDGSGLTNTYLTEFTVLK